MPIPKLIGKKVPGHLVDTAFIKIEKNQAAGINLPPNLTDFVP